MRTLLILTFFLIIAVYSSAAASNLTRLRAGTPNGVFVDYGLGPRLDRVSVDVWNAGSVEARGVRVTVIMPEGQVLTLSGPTTLGRNEKVTYSSGAWARVLSSKKLRAKVTCSNCRK